MESVENGVPSQTQVSKNFAVEFLDREMAWVPLGVVTARVSNRAAQKMARKAFEHSGIPQDQRVTVRTTDSSGKLAVYDVFYGPPGAAREALKIPRVAKTSKIKRNLWPKSIGSLMT